MADTGMMFWKVNHSQLYETDDDVSADYVVMAMGNFAFWYPNPRGGNDRNDHKPLHHDHKYVTTMPERVK